MLKNKLNLAISLALGLTLAGCGGGSKDAPSNVAPVITSGSFSVNEDDSLQGNVDATDQDGDTLTFSVTSTTTQGELSFNADGSFTYTPNENYFGSDSFTLDVTDGTDSASKDINITVESVNDLPVIEISPTSTNEKEVVTLTANVSDIDSSISSYLWQQTSELDIDLITENESVTFTAPEVYKNEQVELELIVTDEHGDSATQSVTVDIEQLTYTTTISGNVSHQALHNGSVSIRLSEQNDFAIANINDDGEYQIELTVDDSQVNEFISVIAHGDNSNSTASYISTLGSFQKIHDLAGNDEVLTEDEYFSVNVSNITTAQYGLVKVLRNGSSISTDAELEELNLQISADTTLTLASAIEIPLNKLSGTLAQGQTSYSKKGRLGLVSQMNDNENSTDTTTELPEGTDNTLELVEAVESAQDYVAQVQGTQELTDSTENTLSNDKLKDKSEYKLPVNYYLLPTSTIEQSLGIFSFNEDGTGTWFKTLEGNNQQAITEFTWNDSESEITLTFVDPEQINQRISVDISGDIGRIDKHTTTKSMVISRYSSHGRYDDLLIEQISDVSYSNSYGHIDELTFTNSSYASVTEQSESKIHSGIKKTNTLPFNANKLTSAFFTLPKQMLLGDLNTETVSVYADKFTFNQDGTGSTKVLNKSFNWEKDGDELTITYADNTQHIINQVNAKSDVAGHLVLEQTDGTDLLNKTLGEGRIIEDITEWTDSNIVGIYQYDNAIFDSPLEQFWIELNDDNTVLTISISDKDGNGSISDDEITRMTGDWAKNSDGTISVTRYKDKTSGAYSTDCNAENTNCYLFNIRNWELVAQSDDKYLLFQHHDWGNLWQNDVEYEYDQQQYDIRTIYKVTERPVAID